MIELQPIGKERCVLVGVSTRSVSRGETEEYLDELALLADTAGAEVVKRVTQDRDRIEPATFIGKGKVEELRTFVTERKLPLVIFDDDLSAVQVRNLERELECKVLDRSALILDIFATRAKSNEAKTQVELAQLQYLLPRLTRQWTHLSKQYGGIGTKGPGETQIETDRRLIKTRISHLKEKLERISKQRVTQRKGRTRHTRAALVGYTNVGKSTLLNYVSGSEVFVENRLFATLDPTTRLVPLSSGAQMLMTDTVGFIRKLPPHLVASFKSTLEEITEADLLLHVVDVTSKHFEEQIQVVKDTLEDIGVHDKPTLMVFNKIDRLAERSMLHVLAEQYPRCVFISAARGININGFKQEVLKLLESEFVEEQLRVSQAHQKLISYLHSVGEVLDTAYEDNSVLLKLRFPKKDKARVLQMVNAQEHASVE
ncbi:MAG: GTPase HflX [Ignavibacteriae bacterium]|nr:GTPase HflX [Ignavibacteriota bacterium]